MSNPFLQVYGEKRIKKRKFAILYRHALLEKMRQQKWDDIILAADVIRLHLFITKLCRVLLLLHEKAEFNEGNITSFAKTKVFSRP